MGERTTTRTQRETGTRLHAGDPAVEAHRHHYRTRALRRTVKSYWDEASGTWVRWDTVTGQVVSPR
jgi:hypothetical protein